MKRLILVGAGHAHLIVLDRFRRQRPDHADIVLISPQRWQYYSGMIPGWMTGSYTLDDCRIDADRAAKAAGARVLRNAVAGVDTARQVVHLADGTHLPYDILSLNTGSEVDDAWFAALGDRVLPVKPLSRFAAEWRKLTEDAAARAGFRLIVAGGGGAGVELAFAARRLLDRIAQDAQVTLVAGGPALLGNTSVRVQDRMRILLQDAGITVVPLPAVGTRSGIMLGNGQRLPADRVIAATGARPPEWLRRSGLVLDADGFVLVNSCHQSLSHPDVFAVGDVCGRSEPAFGRSGVHAVRAGPILAHNLSAALGAGRLRPYRPNRAVLQIYSCGDGSALAVWGRWSAYGRWVWKWKDAIDRRFIDRFGKHAPTPCKELEKAR